MGPVPRRLARLREMDDELGASLEHALPSGWAVPILSEPSPRLNADLRRGRRAVCVGVAVAVALGPVLVAAASLWTGAVPPQAARASAADDRPVAVSDEADGRDFLHISQRRLP